SFRFFVFLGKYLEIQFGVPQYRIQKYLDSPFPGCHATPYSMPIASSLEDTDIKELRNLEFRRKA
ncbi:hypothetical protein GCK32_021580, partial [Trichostrongylus colubriformis]